MGSPPARWWDSPENPLQFWSNLWLTTERPRLRFASVGSQSATNWDGVTFRASARSSAVWTQVPVRRPSVPFRRYCDDSLHLRSCGTALKIHSNLGVLFWLTRGRSESATPIACCFFWLSVSDQLEHPKSLVAKPLLRQYHSLISARINLLTGLETATTHSHDRSFTSFLGGLIGLMNICSDSGVDQERGAANGHNKAEDHCPGFEVRKVQPATG